MGIFEKLESNIRSYCRSFPTIFTEAEGAILKDEKGNQYIDFFSGAGVLNYGHNHPKIKEKLLRYIEKNGLVHGLDMSTVAKREFLESFAAIILKPRKLNYKILFPGPTGTNAVEVALKTVRNATGRENIIAFSGGFHGVTFGSLAMTANAYYREAAGMPLMGSHFMPYDGYLGDNIDTTEYLDRVLCDRSSGVDFPAAIIVETVQGEGGVNVASFSWLRSLEKVCRKHQILLIIDDIQMGCGRTGSFFSFEEASISPDCIVLSKSLSGFGLPLSVVLIKPELDRWKPGQHNGTFRGNNLAFVTGKAAFEIYWQNDDFAISVRKKGGKVRDFLEQEIQQNWPEMFKIRGRGMIQGVTVQDEKLASQITRKCFDKGLVIETCGSRGEVIKFLSPLTISEEELYLGLEIFKDSIQEIL